MGEFAALGGLGGGIFDFFGAGLSALGNYYQRQQDYQFMSDMQEKNWDRKTQYGAYMAELQNQFSVQNQLRNTELSGITVPSSIMNQHSTISSSSMGTTTMPQHVMDWAKNYQAKKMSVTPSGGSLLPSYQESSTTEPLSEFDNMSFEQANKSGDISVDSVSEAAPLVSIPPFQKQTGGKLSESNSFSTPRENDEPGTSTADDDETSKFSYNG